MREQTDLGTAVMTAVDVAVDFDAFDARYDVFRVQSSGEFVPRRSLARDLAAVLDGVLSVKHAPRDRSFHVLCSKGAVTKADISRAIASRGDGEDFRVFRLFDWKDDAERRWVTASLLLAELGRDASSGAVNANGRLLTFGEDDFEEGQVHCVEISLDEHFTLHFDVRTFTSLALKDRIRFRRKRGPETYAEWCVDGRALRRVLPTDSLGESERYIERQLPGRKFTRTFLDATKQSSYEKTRAARVLDVVERFNARNEGIAHFELREFPLCRLVSKLDGEGRLERRVEDVAERGVKIVVPDKDERCLRAAECVKDALSRIGARFEDAAELDRTGLNVAIVRERPSFASGNFEDRYVVHDESVVVQHMNAEEVLATARPDADLSERAREKAVKALETAMTIVCAEIATKAEVAACHLDDTAASALPGRTTTYFTPRRLEDRGEFSFLDCLTVDEGGAMEFGTVDIGLFADDAFNAAWARACEAVWGRYRESDIEGVVATEGLEFAIVKTGLVTLPSKEVPKRVAESAAFFLTVEDILAMRQEPWVDEDVRKALDSALRSARGGKVSSSVVDREVKNLGRSSAGRVRKALNAVFKERYGRVLRFNYRNAETMKELFNGLFGVGCAEVDGMPCYWVGERRQGPNPSLGNAAPVRGLAIANGTADEAFGLLLPLLSVDFVRNGRPTVLPFPFKHLREWLDVQERLEGRERPGTLD